MTSSSSFAFSSVYVAGSSRERARVRAAMDVVNRSPGLVLTHDWLAVMDAAGPDTGLSRLELAQAGAKDIAAVTVADALWLLLPQEPTIGAWFELGYFARGWQQEGKRNETIIISGPGEVPLFVATVLALGAQRYPTDAEAAAYLRNVWQREVQP